MAIETGQELWLITADGEWPIHVALTEDDAESQAEYKQKTSPNRKVRVTKVVISSVEEFVLQSEVINRKLVPRAEAVT